MFARRSRALAAGLATAAIALVAAPAHAGDPSSNTSPNGLYNCNYSSSAISSACLSGAVADFNTGRQKEGLGTLKLPTNFTSLSPGKQLLVLTNIDRADRGMAQILGISSALSSYAKNAAAGHCDVGAGGCQAWPSWAYYGAANQADVANTLWAEFLWMYDDGPGSNNVDCTSSNPGGCWSHRHNVLANIPSPMYMGIGLANNNTSNASTATLLLGRDTHDHADYFAWSSEFRYFNHRGQPTISVAASSGKLSLSIYRHSRTTYAIQKWNGSSWVTVIRRGTGGTASATATWRTGAYSVSRGTYRVVSLENSRFLAAWSRSITVN